MTIYAAIDTETWGLNRSYGIKGLAQLSIVIEDTEVTKHLPVSTLPHLTVFVAQDGDITGELYALQMNAWIMKEIIDGLKGLPTKYPVMPVSSVGNYAANFLRQNRKDENTPIYPIGQNFGSFDYFFLPQAIKDVIHYRAVEMSSVFIKPGQDPKSLQTIKKDLGFDPHISHNAYHEAMDYILCLRTTYGGNTTPYDKENT